MTDPPTRPHDFSRISDPQYGMPAPQRIEPYPSATRNRSGWLVSLAVLCAVLAVAVGILVALFLQARHDLTLTKDNLARTRSAQTSSTDAQAGLRRQLSSAQQEIMDLQLRLDGSNSALATARSTAKRQDAAMSDLRTCLNAYVKAEQARANGDLATAATQMSDADSECNRATDAMAP